MTHSISFNCTGFTSVTLPSVVALCMNLQSTANATIARSSFTNRTTSGEALHISDSSVWIEQCIISNNNNGAIYFSGSNSLLLVILQTIFTNNSNFENGGAIQIHAQYDSNSFPYYLSNVGYNIFIINSTFLVNRVGHRGGAIYFSSGNIIILNSTFINNSASDGVGGAILYSDGYSAVTVILLINSTFSHNSAANCGVVKMKESYIYEYNIIHISGSTFTYNRAIDETPGNNGSGGAGGVICTKSANVYIMDSNFSHNSAAGDGGVIQADNSQVLTIEGSIFNNNTAGGNGGALLTDLYPTRYMITNSIFINNQAGGDGGAMYVRQAGSYVTIHKSTFSHNYAGESGGAISIVGSTLHLNRTNIYENTANIGEVINAYNSNVIINNPEILTVQEPMVSTYCAPYDNSNTTDYPTTEQNPPLASDRLNQTSTTNEDGDITTTAATLSAQQPDEVTSIDVTVKDGTSTFEPVSSDSNSALTTSLVENYDTGQHNLHTTVPGYVAIGVSAILLVLFILFGVIIIVKIFRVKPARPQRVNHLNSGSDAENKYPTMENEYTLPEVHLVST